MAHFLRRRRLPAITGAAMILAAVFLLIPWPSWRPLKTQLGKTTPTCTVTADAHIVCPLPRWEQKSVQQEVELSAGRSYWINLQIATSSPAVVHIELIDKAQGRELAQSDIQLVSSPGSVRYSHQIQRPTQSVSAELRIFSDSPTRLDVSDLVITSRPRWTRPVALALVAAGILTILLGYKNWRWREQANAIWAAECVDARYGLLIVVFLTTLAACLTLRHQSYEHAFILGDETYYSVLSRFFGVEHLLATSTLVRQLPNSLYFGLYHWVFRGNLPFLQMARLQNVFAYSLALLPVYWIARRFVPGYGAVLATIAAALTPLTVYTAAFMPESMYFLGFSILVWILVGSLPRHPILAAAAGGSTLGLLALIKPHALILVVPIALLFVYFKRRVQDAYSWPVCLGLIGGFLGAVGLSLEIASYLLTGHVMFSLGAIYGPSLKQSAAGMPFWPIAKLIGTHLCAITSMYGLALVVAGLALVTPAKDGDSQWARLQALLYTILSSLTVLLFTTSKFTVSNAHPNSMESINRVHGRYYSFLLPWLLICFVAGLSRIDRRKWTFPIGLGLVAVATVLWNFHLRSLQLMYFPDFPDAYWLEGAGRTARIAFTALTFCMLAFYAIRWNGPASVALWLFVVSGLSGSLWLTRELAMTGPGNADVAASVFKVAIARNAMDRGLLVGESISEADLYRLFFNLGGMQEVVADATNRPVSAEMTGGGQAWVIVHGGRSVAVPFGETLSAGGYTLYLPPAATATEFGVGSPALTARLSGTATLIPGPFPVGIDQVGPNYSGLPPAGDLVLPAGSFTVSGWAIDEKEMSLAGGVDVSLDGVPYRAAYGLIRPDVAQYFKEEAYYASGYSFYAPAEKFAKGKHVLTIRVLSSDLMHYHETAPYHLVAK